MDHLSAVNRSQAVQPNNENALKQRSLAFAATGPSGLIRFSSAWLFQSAKEIEIEYRGEVYRLRQTALGKLILTK